MRPDANSQGQAGGGGGAGGVGSNGTLGATATGHGGPGVLVNILDANHYWGGGGGGGSAITAPSNGGIGGGGAGSQRFGGNSGVTITYGTPGGSAYAAAVNSTGGNGTGGGGGGGGIGGIMGPGTGVGGSGNIILRYRSVRPSTSLTVGGDFKIQSKSGTVVEDKRLVNSLTKSTTIEGNVLFNTNVNATNLTTSGALASLGTTQLSNTLINGVISNNTTNIFLSWETRSFGTGWVINTTNWLLNNLNSAQLNIHNIVVWDESWGSSWFGVCGFTASAPQQVLFLSTATQNKGIALTATFNYDGANSYIYFAGVGNGTILRYRIT